MHSPAAPRRPPDSKVLAALGAASAPQFRARLERVSLPQGEVIYEAGDRTDYLYFPETAVFSMLTTMEDGTTIEVGPVGDEGLVGLNVYLGADVSPTRVIVHVEGSAVRAPAEALRQELAAGSALPRLLLRYTRMLLAMTGQSVACNKLHSLRQQFARWLLTMHDYARQDELRLTHELMALTLGVRRAGVSEAAHDLREAGVLDYERGHIRVLDRRGLERAACECYGVVREEFDRLYADLPRLAG